MLSSPLLRDYVGTFWGYGDYQAKYWFVGMEEGGGRTEAEVAKRLASWEKHGRQELSELVRHHQESDLAAFTGDSGDIQTTWGQLIRVVLASEVRPTDDHAVKAYQISRLGSFGGETALLELMPLPSPDAKTWYYDKWSWLPELRTRSRYKKSYTGTRVQHLRQRIAEYKPTVVMFYSLTYKDRWQEVTGVPLVASPISGVETLFGDNGHTLFLVVPQPAAWIKGKGNDYYEQVGMAIARMLAAAPPRTSA